MHKYTTIGHKGYRLCSPLSGERLGWLIAGLDLPSSPRILDLCAGKAELTLRLLERYGGEATAIDQNPHFMAEAAAQRDARVPPEALTLITQDVASFDLEAQAPRFDLVICVGARPYGDRLANLRKLMSFAKPGGQLLIAEGYWRSEPAPEYLDYLGDSAEAEYRFCDHIDMAAREGLRCIYTMASTTAEFDHYDGLFGANIERYIAANPDDPDVPAMAQRIRGWRQAFLRWGRESMGFGWYLYLLPPAR